MKAWTPYIKGFKGYLQLEKSLSANTIQAYLHDIEKLVQYIDYIQSNVQPEKIDYHFLQEFLNWIHELGMTSRTQARVISGIKAFYKYLLLENMVNDDPTTLLEGPKIGQKLPDFLTVEEINALIAAIDKIGRAHV